MLPRVAHIGHAFRTLDKRCDIAAETGKQGAPAVVAGVGEVHQGTFEFADFDCDCRALIGGDGIGGGTHGKFSDALHHIHYTFHYAVGLIETGHGPFDVGRKLL